MELSLWTYSIIKAKIKLLKQIFCSPSVPKHSLEYKIQKAQYYKFLIYIICTSILLLSAVIFGDHDSTILLLCYPIHIIMLYLMIKQNLMAVKIIFSTTTIFFPLIIILESTLQSYLLSLPILQITLIALNSIMTDSVLSSMISFSINYIISKSLISNKLIAFYQVASHDIIYNIFEKQLSTQLSFGFILILIINVHMRLNKNLKFKQDYQKFQISTQKNKLRESNHELQELITNQVNLFQSVIHELRNPLNIISGCSQLALMKKLLSSDIKQYLENIGSCSEMIKSFVNNLLDAAKMQKTDLECSPELSETFSFFQKVWGTSKILIEKNKLVGALFISKNMPNRLNIDKIRVTQIIYNLVGNSVKFTKKGYIAIICSWIDSNELVESSMIPTDEDLFRQLVKSTFKSLEASLLLQTDTVIHEEFVQLLERPDKKRETMRKYCMSGIKTFAFRKIIDNYHKVQLHTNKVENKESSDASGDADIKLIRIPRSEQIKTIVGVNKQEGYLKIEVMDSGCGIPQEKMKDLFTKFSQLGSDSDKQVGTGLGLWISHHLCKKMQGDMAAFSKQNIGSVFVGIIKCSGSN